MLDKTEHARQRILDRPCAIFINFAPHADRVWDIAPDGGAGLFKFAEKKSFLSAIWKKHVDRFEMGAGHGEDVRRTIDEVGGERLAAQIADGYAFDFANLHGIKTRRLSTDRVHAR